MESTTSVYETPEVKHKLEQARLRLIRLGITYPKVRIGCAYMPKLKDIPLDQLWVQRSFLR